MTTQVVTLDQWDWVCFVFYDATALDSPEIKSRIREIGCDYKDVSKCMRLLYRKDRDTGFTLSSFRTRMSVMVICRTSSAEEFQNTFDHEKGHLARHICMADYIDPYGEEAQYLAGEIALQMYPASKKYLCACD